MCVFGGEEVFERSTGDGESAESVDRIAGQLGPGRFGGEVQQGSSAAAGEGGGDGEQPEPEPFGFPPAGVLVGEGEELHPDGQLGSR